MSTKRKSDGIKKESTPKKCRCAPLKLYMQKPGAFGCFERTVLTRNSSFNVLQFFEDYVIGILPFGAAARITVHRFENVVCEFKGLRAAELGNPDDDDDILRYISRDTITFPMKRDTVYRFANTIYDLHNTGEHYTNTLNIWISEIDM